MSIKAIVVALVLLLGVAAAHGEWTLQTVDSWGGDPALVLDSRGRPRIAYQIGPGDTGQLKYAAWNGDSWNYQLVDATPHSGFEVSLTLDNSERPRIAYQASTPNTGLRYASWNGSSWDVQVVESGWAGWGTSIVTDISGLPRITFFDGNESNPDTRIAKYAAWNGISWDVQTVAPVKYNTGTHMTSLKLAQNGTPSLSFGDEDGLKYATWNGTSWDIATVDSASSGMHNSMVLSQNGAPSIAYANTYSGPLKYAKWDGSAWNTQTVDNASGAGQYCSLALDSTGSPWIAYYAESALKLAHWAGTAWDIDTVTGVSASNIHPSLALDSNDNPWIAYCEPLQYELRLAFVPEPATLSLLALGGLAILKRRGK